jgi:GR25 family glycosyltransferase involved in LPS biosynthesis
LLLEEKYLVKSQRFVKTCPQLIIRTATTTEKAREAVRQELIRENLTYAIMADDNFKFLVRSDFITRAAKLMDQEHDLGQVVFNRNYAIALDEIGTEVGYTCHVDKALFFRHAMGKGKNANWPHFSIQPAIHKVAAWKAVGAFAETNLEVEYAWRYWKAGFRTGFLPLIYCIAIPDTLKKVKSVKVASTTLSIIADSKFETRVINLARRTDRWEKMSEKLNQLNIKARRFDAVDGRAITLTAEEKKIFEENTFNWRAGVVGCALSHYRLWQELIADPLAKAYLILEDDVEFGANISTKLVELQRDYAGQDLVYLGASLYRDKRTPERYDPTAEHSQLRVWDYKDRATLDSYCLGGSFAYLISKACAGLCCAEIERRGIRDPIDCFLFGLFPKLNVWEMVPYLIYSEYVDARIDKVIDSDIQINYEQVKR